MSKGNALWLIVAQAGWLHLETMMFTRTKRVRRELSCARLESDVILSIDIIMCGCLGADNYSQVSRGPAM